MKAGADSTVRPEALAEALCGDARVVVVVGHYGVGKTNLAIGLALSLSAAGRRPVVADLDLVNPYFRTSDYARRLEGAGARVVSPTFAGTTLDTPSVSGRLLAEVELARADPGRALVVDVGGDDAGAAALGRFSQALAAQEAAPPPGLGETPAPLLGADATALAPFSPCAPDVRMLYVVNAYRDLGEGPEGAARVLREVEGASHLAATGVVNNSHLCDETTPEDVERGRAWATEAAEACGLPLVATCVPARGNGGWISREDWPEPQVEVGRYVVTPWQ